MFSAEELLSEQAAQLFTWARKYGWRASIGVSENGTWHAELWNASGATKEIKMPKSLMIRRGKEGSAVSRLIFDLHGSLGIAPANSEEIEAAKLLIRVLLQAEKAGKNAGASLSYAYWQGDFRYNRVSQKANTQDIMSALSSWAKKQIKTS
jgi:hypothetical protein